MRKKSLIFISVLMLMLTACGQNVSVNVNSETGDKKEEASQVTDEVPEEEEEAKEEVTAGTSKAAPVFKLVKKYYSEYYSGKNKTDGSGESLEGKEVYDGMSETLMVADESKDLYPDLYEALNKDAKEALALADKIASENSKSANDDADSSGADNRPFAGPWTDTSRISITRVDDKVISFARDFSGFSGGAHGMYGRTGITYDVETGKRLALTDVVDITQDQLVSVIREKLLDMRSSDSYMDLDENLKNYSLTAENPIVRDPDTDSETYEPGFDWYLGFDGIHFYFGPYEIAAYAIGESDVVIGYDELGDSVNKNYIPDISKGYIVEGGIPVSDGAWEDENDNELEFIFGTDDDTEMYDNWIQCNSLTLKKGDRSAVAEDEYFSFNYNKDSIRQYRVVTADGREYIYACVLSYNDYSDVIVYDITGGDIKLSGVFTCHLAYVDHDTDLAGEFMLTDPDNMIFAEVGDLLGTYTCYGKYVTGADGLPVYADDYYTLSWSSDEIKSLKDIKATVLDGDGNEQGEETIPAGTGFTPIRTDNKSYMDCTLDDGTVVRLKYSKTDYPAEIDGVSVDDLFDGLMYAG